MGSGKRRRERAVEKAPRKAGPWVHAPGLSSGACSLVLVEAHLVEAGVAVLEDAAGEGALIDRFHGHLRRVLQRIRIPRHR